MTAEAEEFDEVRYWVLDGGPGMPAKAAYRVLRNTFVSSLRRRARRPRTTPLPDDGERLAAPASQSPVAALQAREVLAAVAALPADQRDALAAVDVAGLSYDEAARALGIPVGTVMSRLYRGRRRVIQALAACA